MRSFIATIALAIICAALPAQTPTTIKPASTYDQNGITVVSPNQSGWILVKTDNRETVFEKRGEGEILNASVKTIRTKKYETEKERLVGWETLKDEELSKFKRDHLHFNYMRFKGSSCLHYDAFFPLEKTSSNKAAYYNLRGYLCPLPNAKDSAVQIEFSSHSNARGFAEDIHSLSDEFFEKLKLPS